MNRAQALAVGMLEDESPKDFLRRKLIGISPVVHKAAKTVQEITKHVQRAGPYSAGGYRLLGKLLIDLMDEIGQEIGLNEYPSELREYIASYLWSPVMSGQGAELKVASDYAAELVADMLAFRDEDEGMSKAMDFVLRHPDHRRNR